MGRGTDSGSGELSCDEIPVFSKDNTFIDVKKETNKTEVAVKAASHKCTYKDCQLSFSRPWRLAAHLRTHNGERPFACSVEGCNKDYTNNAHLRRHTLHAHNTSSFCSQYKCQHPGCLSVFSNKSNLQRHVKNVHSSTSNFPCPECPQKFLKHNRLKEHMYHHKPSENLLYKCNICERKFVEKYLYKKHLKVHRTYTCKHENCNASFQLWSLLLKHEKIAHAPQKFICAECNKAFTLKTTLTEHLMSHMKLEERVVYRCSFDGCESFSYYARNIRAHVQRHHYGVTFPCTQCSKKLSSKQKLTDHVRLLHSNIKCQPKIKSKPSKPRKDVGKRQRSMISQMLGISLPAEKEKELISSIIVASE